LWREKSATFEFGKIVLEPAEPIGLLFRIEDENDRYDLWIMTSTSSPQNVGIIIIFVGLTH
jgi:hypothetical protein